MADADIDVQRKLPPLNPLRAFEAAARHLSISRAASELNVTPGAVSQQARVLEDHAGGPVFKREPGVHVRTELGRALQQPLREAFEHLRRAAEIVYGLGPRQSLKVSAPPSFAMRWFAPRMSRFAAEHPEI